MKLDKSDKIILTHLEFNSRIKEKELANLCRLSKDSIRYRIKKLEEQGLILGYSALIDYTKLGCLSYKIYLKIQGSETDWSRLRSFLDSQPAVFVRFESQTDWNFGIGYFAKSLYDYYLFERSLFTKFGHIIQSSELCHMVDAAVFEPRMLLNKMGKEFNLFGGVKDNKIDSIDKILLEQLLRNSSQPLLKLAEHVKLSPDATKKRILGLEKEQIIRKYITKINYPKLGFETYKVFIFVKGYTEETEKKLIAKLSSYNSIRNIIRMVGPWKLEVEFMCNSYDDFFNLLKEIRTSFSENITSINYSIFRNDVYYPSKKVLSSSA
ncbi:MAG TPA: Lrp/AsnC family transcriptional regulator [Candidatus Nanoarchaeia archaeon]|nr:Lrp/AsnC family transcriptional regulator [Candidatus Nanoarchaeia archaeon]